MAIKYEDECVGCPPELGCLGSACSKRNVPHYYCDGEDCGEEFHPTELYHVDDQMLCVDCLVKQFEKVGI